MNLPGILNLIWPCHPPLICACEQRFTMNIPLSQCYSVHVLYSQPIRLSASPLLGVCANGLAYVLLETYRDARKKCEYFNSANCVRYFPLALFWCALIRLSHMRVCLALAVVAQIKIAHDMQMSNFVQMAQYYSRTFF